jgi:hypothetical protein
MPLIIPIETDTAVNDFTLSCSLEGEPIALDLSWSPRSSSWYCSLYRVGANQERIPIALGRRITVAVPLLRGVTGTNRPPGELLPIDTTAKGDDPAHDELGTRVQLLYYTAAELAAMP